MDHKKQLCFIVNHDEKNAKDEFLVVVIKRDTPKCKVTKIGLHTDYEEANEMVMGLNRDIGLTIDDITQIVVSSMVAGRQKT